MRFHRRRGLTLVEMSVASVLLMIVLGLPALLFRSSTRAYSTGVAGGAADAAVRRTLDRIHERLSLVSTTVVPQAAAPNVPWSQVDFQLPAGLVAGVLTWGPSERIALEPEPEDPVDGIDNDGDGLIDEGMVVWTENLGLSNERRHVLCRGVTRGLEGEVLGNGVDDNGNGFVDEAGFVLEFAGERMRVWLTVGRTDAFGTPTVHTVRRTVALRN